MNDDQLKKHGIRRRTDKGCNCNNKSFIYNLPKKLDERIVPYLKGLGHPAFDFKQQAILKIENSNYTITGIRRLKEIRITIKKKQHIGVLDLFEKALICYLQEV